MLLADFRHPNSRIPKGASRWLALLLCGVLCLLCKQGAAHSRIPSASQRLSRLLDKVFEGRINIVPRPGPSLDDLGAAHRLIDTGASVNTRGKNSRATSLMLAAALGDVSFVRCLFSRGARVNLEAANGSTALEKAISCSSPECVELLLQYGASTKIWSHTAVRMTPLMLASYLVDHEERTSEKCDAVIKVLLRHGADAHVVNSDGNNVLHLQLATRPRLSAVRLLLEAGAEVNQVTKSGLTPLDQSELVGATEVAELLKQWGARRSSSTSKRTE